MKKYISKALIFAGMAAMLASCSEDSWNDLYLDGFEGGADNTNAKAINYTLTKDDYALLVKCDANVKLALERGDSAELKALERVSQQGYFTKEIPADVYLPALFTNNKFALAGLGDGSAVNVTYRELSDEEPAELKGINGLTEFKLSDEDYQIAYESKNDYTPAFTPSCPASVGMPRVLENAMDEPLAGQYVIASYNVSDVDPDFGQKFEMTSVINNNLKSGEKVEISGVVTGMCERGVIVADKTGAILAYSGSYTPGTYAIGDQLKISATLGNYKNCLQVDLDNSSVIKMGSQKVEYPKAVELTENYLVEAGKNENPVCAVYGHITGTVKVDGTYINIIFGENAKARGSVYYASDETKALLVDGSKVSILGYFTQTSGSSITNANIVVTDVEAAAKARRRGAPKRVVAVPSTQVFAAWVCNGSSWSQAASNVNVLQPADYSNMGLGYGSFTNKVDIATIQRYLSLKYPYAAKDAVQYVAYKVYANKETKYHCTQFTFDGTEWTDTFSENGVTTVTNQYVFRNGKWQFDPSIEITLPVGRNQPESMKFFQACVDWVKDNVPNGSEYITSYGNNDYYTGASAYQGNIDLRPKAARDQYSGYDGMSDEEVIAILKKHFEEEVGPAVLSQFYPDLAPLGDFHPTITIHFGAYNGSTTENETIVFETVETGKYKFVSCTWNKNPE